MEAAAQQENVLDSGALIAGKYRLDRKLGEGGMGAVFLAHNEVLEQRVVIKMLHGVLSANTEAIARFLREARAAAKIQNEHVARVLDFGTLPSGAPFLVMEFLEGRDLQQELDERGALPVAEVVDHVTQALDGLAVAHEVGIVHRDIKPANLFLAKRQGGGSVVKILDFGIAKSDEEASGRLTATKGMMGSPLFMSPEQYRSAKYVVPASDLWAMGVVMYELLTGQLPFQGEGLGDLVPAIMTTAPPPPRSLRADIPAEIERIVLWCLEKDPAARPPGARALAIALAPFSTAGPGRGSAPSLPIFEPLRSSSVAGPVPMPMAMSAPAMTTTHHSTPAPARWIIAVSAVGFLGLAGAGVALAMRARETPPAAAPAVSAVSANAAAGPTEKPPAPAESAPVVEASSEPPPPSSAPEPTASAKPKETHAATHPTTAPPAHTPTTHSATPPPGDFDKRK